MWNVNWLIGDAVCCCPYYRGYVLLLCNLEMSNSFAKNGLPSNTNNLRRNSWCVTEYFWWNTNLLFIFTTLDLNETSPSHFSLVSAKIFWSNVWQIFQVVSDFLPNLTDSLELTNSIVSLWCYYSRSRYQAHVLFYMWLHSSDDHFTIDSFAISVACMNKPWEYSWNSWIGLNLIWNYCWNIFSIRKRTLLWRMKRM
jgi:hypothetical protein